jgi:hypothetical protein
MFITFLLVIQDSKSTQVQIVLNGSAQVSKQNKSLNVCIYKGKNLMTKQRFQILN